MKTRVYIRQYAERLAIEVYIDGDIDYTLSNLQATEEQVKDALAFYEGKAEIKDERMKV